MTEDQTGCCAGPSVLYIIVLVIGLATVASAILFGRSSDAGGILREPCEPGGAGEGKVSFSRMAGAIGAVSFAAYFSAFGLWILESLAAGEKGVGKMISDTFLFPLIAAAFFFPYAFNQLASIWRPVGRVGGAASPASGASDGSEPAADPPPTRP